MYILTDYSDITKFFSTLEKKHTLECGFQAICYLFVTYLVHFISKNKNVLLGIQQAIMINIEYAS